jgi:hypothetical protein
MVANTKPPAQRFNAPSCLQHLDYVNLIEINADELSAKRLEFRGRNARVPVRAVCKGSGS